VAVGQTVTAEVELVKEDYMVVSLPEHGHATALVGTKDFNLRNVDVHTKFQPRQTLKCIVKALPTTALGHRTVLALKDDADATAAKKRKTDKESSEDKGKKKSARPSADELIGSILKGTVSAVKPLQVEVKLANRWRGRVHITEAGLGEGSKGLAGKFTVEDEIEAEVLGIAHAPDGSDTGEVAVHAVSLFCLLSERHPVLGIRLPVSVTPKA